MRFGITLDRKVNVEDFLGAVAKTQGKSLENIVLFTVFNNEFLNRLEPRSWQQEIAHHLNFSVKLVCYEVQHMNEPTYHNYQKRDLAQRSVKLELRQRIYSPKTNDYRITYMPFLLEVSHTMHWHHLLTQVELILAKILPETKPPSNGHPPPRKSL